jgi:hypothetical protein
MKNTNVLNKTLAIAGTALVWFPILAPIFFSLASLIDNHEFRFDYLMPAELFVFALVGGGLLIWAAVRVHARQKIIGWGLGIAVGMLIGGQGLAVVTGLASGETEPVGWRWVLVLATLVIFSLALIATGIGGILLLRDIFRKKDG